MPISQDKKKIFNNRILHSVAGIISIKPIIVKKSCDSRRYITIKERYNYAIKTSKYISHKKKNIVYKNAFFISLAASFLIIFLLFPNLIHANSLIGIEEHTCCGKCCEGSCIGCCNCCGCDKCCGPNETKCCYETGDSFQNTFCNWPGCLGLICLGPCLYALPGEVCGLCCSESVEKPNITVIIKEKDCGC